MGRLSRRWRELQYLAEPLSDDELAVYEDEVDIHLNPKIGPDGTSPAKRSVDASENVNRYVAGGIDSRTGELICLEDEKKSTLLFINLLSKLVQHYRHTKVIHVILDN